MTSLEIIGLIAIILMSAFAIVAIIVSIPLFKLLRKANNIVGSLDNQINPLMGELNSIVGKLNLELATINDITQSAGSIVEQLEKIVRLARIIITSPIVKVISTAAGIVDGIKKTKSKK